jgi:hypothetical protein
MAEHPCDDDNTMTTHPPSDPRTGPSQLLCPVCWTAFTKVRRQRYCTDTSRRPLGPAATLLRSSKSLLVISDIRRCEGREILPLMKLEGGHSLAH